MSYHVFFAFSAGLAKTLSVPAGTKASLLAHVEEVEQTLGLKRSKYKDSPVHWDYWDKNYRAGFPKVPDDVLCETVQQHNAWVREWYGNFAHWSEHPFRKGRGHQATHFIDRGWPVGHPSEKITPEEAQKFWHGFEMLKVSPDRWTCEYYRDRMDHLYKVMRGCDDEGVSFDQKALTAKQAGAVIRLFETYLPSHDLHLEVPNGRDFLASSYDGGYSWCEKCGAVAEGDESQCRKRKCPLREEMEAL